jgi:predicted ATPase
MIYLESVKINSIPNVKKFPKGGIEFQCSDVNLIVGNQGVGKSSLLKMMREKNENLEMNLSDFVIKNGVETFFFDCEKDNPRLKDPNHYTKMNGEDVGIGYVGAIMTSFNSHGEVMKRYTVDALKKAKDCVIFLDEPESGLSITNQFELIKSIKKAVNNNCQLFIATHCYPLIESFDVISLEHFETLKGIDFINKIIK